MGLESKDLVEVTRCKNCGFCRLDSFNESILTTKNKIHIGCVVHIGNGLSNIIPTNPDGYCYLAIPATKGCSIVDVLRDTFTKHQNFIKQLTKDNSKDMEFVLSDDYVDTQLTRLYKSLND